MTPLEQPKPPDPFELARFVEAQHGCYERAIQELRTGRKETHWMWFVFPQIEGLGRSPTARCFAIRSLAEASAYLGHPVLGARILECSRALLGLVGKTASDIFGHPDDLKLRSSMTLFARVPGCDPVFRQVLDAYFGGRSDPLTIQILLAAGPEDAASCAV